MMERTEHIASIRTYPRSGLNTLEQWNTLLYECTYARAPMLHMYDCSKPFHPFQFFGPIFEK